MKTTPKTEKEIIEANLLPKDWYPFTINSAQEKTSKAGNEMIEIEVRVYKAQGFVMLKDYLMDTEFGAGKLRHISETCGLLADYESGGINAEDLEGKEGYCRIGIKKDKDGQYPDKNDIKDYAKEPPKPKEAAPSAPREEKDAEDDIPF